MSEETTTETPATEPTTPVDTPPAAEGNTTKVFDEDYVKKIREEAAAHRTEKQAAKKELEELQKRVKAFEDEKLTAEQRTAKELEELRNGFTATQQRARQAELNYQVALAANSEKLVDVGAAVKLIDQDKLEFSEDGKITNIKDVIGDLKKAHPWLVAPTQPVAPGTGATNPSGGNKTAKKLTRDDLKGMSPAKVLEHYNAGNIDLG